MTGCNPLNRQTKAGLQVITSDVSSSVFLDGQFLDKTPYKGEEFLPGSYSLRIEPDDPSLTPHETSITLTKGLLTVVTWKPGERPETSGGVVYEMEPLTNKNRSELSIVSLPDGVIVKVDDDPKEFTPLLIEDIEPGQHEFEVSLPSYETQKHTINVIEGHRMNITVKLAKATESLPTTTEEVGEADGSGQATSSAKQATESARLQTNESETEDESEEETTEKPPSTEVGSENDGPTVTITSTNFFVSGQEVLRVRDQASTAGEELGFAEVGQSYPYLDETTAGWYKIEFEGEEGWVSSSFSELNE